MKVSWSPGWLGAKFKIPKIAGGGPYLGRGGPPNLKFWDFLKSGEGSLFTNFFRWKKKNGFSFFWRKTGNLGTQNKVKKKNIFFFLPIPPPRVKFSFKRPFFSLRGELGWKFFQVGLSFFTKPLVCDGAFVGWVPWLYFFRI